ncbi:MAG: acetoacetate--CoA ligase [Pseudomonadota bacterium]|nr:acetoacetate--CoA ligase [Pseudomonadota bacterium]
MGDVLWNPSRERVRRSRMFRFMETINRTRGLSLSDYPELHAWSVRYPDRFWRLVWEDCGVVCESAGVGVLEDADRMPGAVWFGASRLNYAQNLLRRRDPEPAIIFRNEAGERRLLSFGALRTETDRLTNALRSAGLKPGERVAGYLPNVPEAVVAMLATVAVGATWSACSPDFGPAATLDRLAQVAPRILFATDGYRYGGRAFHTLGRVAELAGQLPRLGRVVVIPYLSDEPDIRDIPLSSTYKNFLGTAIEKVFPFEAYPFDHPLLILFSSGTTGPPKCIVHGAGGTLLQHLKEHVLHTDLGPGDTLFYFTTTGWMMWNWLVGALAAGTTIVLYDGSPVFPNPGALFDVADAEGVTVLGLSPGYLGAAARAGVRPVTRGGLSHLRTILSTGSPLSPEGFDYVYRYVKPDVQLCSISGGTDIVSCFALGNPIQPVRRGELQGPGLGMQVEVFDDNGRSIRGRKGELVCSAPFPSMPLGFLDDPAGRRFRATYFDRFPGVWAHGDFAEITDSGGLVIYGRSDAVLNPGGIRIGTAEIYRQVLRVPEVIDCCAVGQRWLEGERIVLFVSLRGGISLDDELRTRIRETVRNGASPHHAPARIMEVTGIPHTVSGKVAELAVRATIHGEHVSNIDALANPEVLDQYTDRPELRA